MSFYINNNIRLSLLSSNIIRIELNKFNDNNTFFVPCLTEFKGIDGDFKIYKDFLELSFDNIKVTINKNAKNFDSLKVFKNNNIIYKYKRITSKGELPLPQDTPCVFPILDNPRIVVPGTGYTGSDPYLIDNNSKDLYLLIANKDHILLRKLFISLTGKLDMVRLSTFGYFNSRYYPYSQQEAMDMIDKLLNCGLYLDNMVIDTDWRRSVSSNGSGYLINTDLFPDMKKFLDYAHSKDVEIMFNDHPLPVDHSDVFSLKEREYRTKNLQEKLALGLDYWWYDRNWICHLKSPSKKITCETLGMYLFTDITNDYFKKYENNRRPVIMSNVDNILNGWYLKISNFASHRYPIQWSGDTYSSLSYLKREVKNMIKCNNNGIIYFSSDIGGHVGNPSKQDYIRWIQYGSFSPIYRPHCTKDVKIFREPFNYDDETVKIACDYLNARLSLLNMMYTQAYSAYENLTPISKPLSYDYVDDKNTYNIFDTYIFLNKIIVSSFNVASARKVKKQNYISKVHAKFYEGCSLKGKVLKEFDLNTIDFYLHDVPFEKGLPTYNFSCEFTFKLKFKHDVSLAINSDDGTRVYVNNKLELDDFVCHGFFENNICILKANVEYDIRVEYFQASGDAGIGLIYYPHVLSNQKETYLPKGNFVDLNKGIYIEGLQKISRTYDIKEYPLFIKEGSLLPLYTSVNQIKKMSLKNITYDYYPSYYVKDNGFIYEDDYNTTAYKNNICRKSYYQSEYDKDKQCFIIKLDKSIDNLNDNMKFRNAIFKFNDLLNLKVYKVMINNIETQFEYNNYNKALPYFNGSKANKTINTYSFEFVQELDKKYIIEIYMNKYKEGKQ